MTSGEDFPGATDEVRCTYHRSELTRLRCSRCAKPICPRCGVRTPVGLRCPECAGVRGLPTYRTEPGSLAKAAAAGFAVAIIVSLIWAYIPAWNFFLALLLGFSVVESMIPIVQGKRGSELQAVAIGAVLVGLALSRVFIAYRTGITIEQVNQMAPGVERVLYLRPIPDGLYAAISVAIAWYRFR